jgi:hypothetical protein
MNAAPGSSPKGNFTVFSSAPGAPNAATACFVASS